MLTLQNGTRNYDNLQNGTHQNDKDIFERQEIFIKELQWIFAKHHFAKCQSTESQSAA